ncbi:MAG TPA: hypothetical protein VIC33_10445 [Vicinamibacterales bacterium]|jgi:hypothetical protein
MKQLLMVAALGALMLCPSAARAQTSLAKPVTPSAPSPGFFTNYTFHMDAASLSGGDDTAEAFDWDANFGGDLDLIDYGAGRLNFLANYQVVLGNQLRVFDPNQGNYTLEFSSSLRVGRTEFAGVFHHISRHLSDRPKAFAIAWNEAALRVSRPLDAGRWHATLQADLGRMTERAFVDYVWQAEGDATARYDINAHVAAVFAGSVTTIGTDAAVAGRGRLTGGRGEAGVLLSGTRGALELFAAVDRRIDADPIDRQIRTFGLLGFKLLSK